ncbi:MAG TPA: zf-HC2 domain-containing protein [Acidimicrobiales bacterium]|nr:zf-HC2 domain-containing protein [Acidimicrobiales bacterium]
MTFDYDWHVPVDRLERYAAGAAGPIEQDSIEAHLLVCDHCRANLATARQDAAAAHDAMLRAITDRIDQPRRSLHRSTGALQVSLASPALVGASALLATMLLAAVGVAAAIEPRFSIAVLVAVAPLAPVVAAVVGFWPATDPAGALSAATPLAAGRLPFLRALFATAVSAAAGLISSAFTPLGWSDSLVWLAPGFVFAAIVIAAATWMNPLRVAVGLGAGWCVVCTLWARGHRSLATVDAVNELATHGARIQIVCVVVIVVASIVTLSRRDAQPNWRTT